ncbi:MAG: hypothetical protein WEE67_07980 [Chloroflexota bacterium]
MTEHEYEQGLRQWFRTEVSPLETAPDSLRLSLATIPMAAPRGRSDWRWLLVAVAVLVTLTASLAVAIGSGLIPGARPAPPSWMVDDCAPTMDEELVLRVVGDGPQLEVWVYADGLVIIEEDNSSDELQRRLTSSGVEELLDSATAPGLDDCREIPFDGGDGLGVTVRDGSTLNSFHAGYGRYAMIEADPATTAAAAALMARLRDADFGMADQWIDDQWTAFVPDRYDLILTGVGPDGGVGPEAPSPTNLSLPDGSTVSTFGSPMPGGFTVDGDVVWRRCGVVDPSQIEAFRRVLGGLDQGWWNATSALPHDEQPCTEASPQEPAATPDPALRAVAACDLLPFGVELPDGRTLMEGVAWYSDDWAYCGSSSRPDLLNSGILYRIAMRIHPTADADVREWVDLNFGTDGYRESQIAGRTVYLNSCATRRLECAAAIAIAADPYLLVIEDTGWGPGPDGMAYDPAVALEALAEAVITRLPE